MNSKLIQNTLTAVILTSLSTSAGIAVAQLKPNLEIRPGNIEINRPQLQLITTSISGKITNKGSNNGGKPNFACSDISVYLAIALPPSPPQGEPGISLPNYQNIGKSVKAQGNIATGCVYTLYVPNTGIGKPIYVFATSPEKWTTSVNVVDISPVDWTNPLQVTKGQKLENKDLRITATLIK
ncbi:hypothetical protein Cri9333_3566 [Crinalium epipsammum PCC 9333]|uniref:Uncharacterized protein n=1 Tax=Crinalium epipsammum PCC 9333 TaxID=1173022 RepID=K9W3M1_9CYAN|nr:hypothetical protein [Crinalium epipsammum]AFZ14389.1 hypothetical protein Cri9333_3566 [Crinalium epipsammum PCC 9333]